MIIDQPISKLQQLVSQETTRRNLSTDELAELCLSEDHCRKASNGAVVAYSGKYTGRTPKDKFIVEDDETRSEAWWEGNSAMSPATFDHLKNRLYDYFEAKQLYVVDCLAGADPAYQIKVRFVVERPYHALFVSQLFIKPSPEQLIDFKPDWVVMDACRLILDPATDNTRSGAAIVLNFTNQEVLIAGTEYAGEMKKSIFTVMNYRLPRLGVMSMHCSANLGAKGDTALFFGLSGTGKTTLSADPARMLIGDDEHGWSDQGVFNIEGGCYAKCVNLSREHEPEIWDAIKPSAVLENVMLGKGGLPNYGDKSITENTRAAYPMNHIANAVTPSVGGNPKAIFFLTCDALGLLPPISRLSPEQVMMYFLNGYTAKVAGTEAGVTEPTLTFSACFGQPFLPLDPHRYADLLKAKIEKHGSTVWLVNTGWTGGAYGTGRRIDIESTRAILTAALEGNLDGVEFKVDGAFGLEVPQSCPGVDSHLLNPRETWKNKAEYDQKARELQSEFLTHARAYGLKV